ncbi:MAG: M23 family metallopeptidase [Chloroflexota bacterium]
MPAASDATRHGRAWMVRTVVVTLAALSLLTVTPGSPTQARHADLTDRINSARSGQLAYESLMLAADRRLRTLKRERKQTQRKVRKTARNLGRVKERRRDVEGRRDEAGRRLEEALASVEAASQPPALALPSWPLMLLPSAALLLAEPIDTGHLPGLSPAVPPLTLADGSTPTTLEIRALKTDLRKQERQLRKLQRKTRKVQRSKRARVRNLAAIRRQRRSALALRAGSEAALKSRILSMSRLALRRATRKTGVRPGRSTGFVWPVRGRVTQRYGCTGLRSNPIRGGCRFHSGIDIASGYAVPIRAAAVGVVSYVGRNPWDRGRRAFMVVIAHPGGYETLYAHNLPIRRVRVGQLVRKGQVIALMGSTGRSTGAHVHFEIRRGRSTLNPLAFL